MPRIQGAVVIRRPLDAVFDVVADLRNAPRYDPHVLRVDPLTDSAVGRGARWSALMRSGRWPVAVVVECTEYQRPSVLAWTTTTPGTQVRRRLTLDAVPEGTRLSWDCERRSGGPLGALSGLLGLLAARRERATWTALRRVVESATAPVAGRPGLPA
jgi:hypothetical protein